MTFVEIESQWQRCRTREQKRVLWEQLIHGGWFDASRNAVQQNAPATVEAWLNEDDAEKQTIIRFNGAESAQMVRTYLLCARTALDAIDHQPSTISHQPFSPAFLRDLTEQLLGTPRTPQDAPVRVLFPLVWTDRAEGVLAQFALERLPNGCGGVFLAPQQAFVLMDDDFLSIFANAPAAVRALVPSAFDGCDVRVTVEAFNDAEQKELWRGLRGRSAGGALALGLWSLATGTLLGKGIVVSAEVTDDGRFLPIGAGITKAIETAKAGLRVFLTGNVGQTASLPCETREDELGLTVKRKATLKEAAEFASGRLRELLAYFDTLIAEANKLPPYYPKDAKLECVRVRVRVSSERQRFDSRHADERERARRKRLADEENVKRAYAHRFQISDFAAPLIRISDFAVLDWDNDVRGKVRRGVIVGDPGLGKTWLLKWEAKRHAEEAKQQLLTNGDVSRITIPVNLRLTDVAEALANGAATLTEAVVASLRDAAKSVRDLVSERLGTDNCLLLLDAFDEAPADKRHGLLTALGEWVHKHPQARVFFTSRAVGYAPPWRIPKDSEIEREMELLPFDDGQLSAFLDAFFASDAAAAQELRDILHRAPQLRGMAQYPLLLGFLCVLYQEEQGTQSDRLRHFANLRRSELYEFILRRLLSGAWHDTPHLLSDAKVAAKLRLLAQVAFRLFAEGKEQFFMEELLQVTQNAYRDLYSQPLSEAELTSKIEEWSETDGLLIKAGTGDNPPYLFLHLTFQEYLTACALAKRANREGWNAIAELMEREIVSPYWEHIILLLTDKLTNLDPLLKLLRQRLLDADENVRREAARTLNTIWEEIRMLRRIEETSGQHNDMISALMDRVLYDEAADARKAAIEALGEMWEVTAQNGDVLLTLVAALRDVDWHVRVEAIEALGRLGKETPHPAITSVLVTVVRDDTDMRDWAVRALLQIGEAVKQHPALLPTLVDTLWFDFDNLDDNNYFMMDFIDIDLGSRLRLLGEIGEMAAQYPPTIPTLLNLFDYPFTWPFLDANPGDVALALSRMGDSPEVLSALVKLVYAPFVRGGFAKEPYLKVLPVILNDLRSEDKETRRKAAEMLGDMGETGAQHYEAFPEMRVSDENEWRDTLNELSEMRLKQSAQYPETIPALATALHDPEREVRIAAAIALGRLKAADLYCDKVLPELMAALKEGDNNTRKHAAEVLGKMSQVVAQD